MPLSFGILVFKARFQSCRLSAIKNRTVTLHFFDILVRPMSGLKFRRIESYQIIFNCKVVRTKNTVFPFLYKGTTHDRMFRMQVEYAPNFAVTLLSLSDLIILISFCRRLLSPNIVSRCHIGFSRHFRVYILNCRCRWISAKFLGCSILLT